MDNLIPTYSPNIPGSQHRKARKPEVYFQEHVATQKFDNGKLWYKLSLYFAWLSSLDPESIKDCFGLEKIPTPMFTLLRRLNVYLKKNHYSLEGNVMNIAQKTLAKEWGVHPSTVQRQMNQLKKLGLVVDTQGDIFTPQHPLWKSYDLSDGPKKQYFVCFQRMFAYLEKPLIRKRCAHIYKQKSFARKKPKETPPKPPQSVDNPNLNPVDTKMKTIPKASINARYKENINIFYKYTKNLNEILTKTAQKQSTKPIKEIGTEVYELSNGPDEGAFADLFAPTLYEKFARMSEKDKELFLKFKHQQIIHYMRQYSAYSSRQERANRGLAVLAALRRPH